jgi:hypothetical protein
MPPQRSPSPPRPAVRSTPAQDTAAICARARQKQTATIRRGIVHSTRPIAHPIPVHRLTVTGRRRVPALPGRGAGNGRTA